MNSLLLQQIIAQFHHDSMQTTDPLGNHPDVVEQCLDDDHVVTMLRAHRIPTRFLRSVLKRNPRIPRYRVYVHDLRVIAAYRYRKRSLVRVGGYSKRMRAVRAMAVRTAYTLGLVGGVVVVGFLGKDRAAPVLIDPKPSFNKLIQSRMDQAISNREARLLALAGPRSVKLGADPEFVMRRSNGVLIAASSYFQYRGPIGHDEQGLRNRRGMRPIVELRPAPSEVPELLVYRMKRLLRIAMRRTPQKNVRWYAGSAPMKGYPIGGHIHFTGTKLTTEFLRALDNYLGLVCVMLEDPIRARRRRPKYGYIGDFRWVRHGGFEYRTPSSWLVSESIALAFMHLSRLIALNYEKLTRDAFKDANVAQHFYNVDQTSLRPYFDDAWQDIANLPDYKRLEKALSIIPQLVENGKRWDEMRDIRMRWGLINRKRARPKSRARRSTGHRR